MATILSAVSFTVALVGIKIKKRIQKGLIIAADLIWVIPAVILTSVFILFVFEELPRTLLVASSVLIRPVDVSTGLSILVRPPNSDYNQGQLLAGAFAFCIISWFARYMIGYHIVRLIIPKAYAYSEIPKVYTYSREHNAKPRQTPKYIQDFVKSRSLRWISLLLVGMPLYSFVVLFFSKAIEGFYPSSLFLIFLVVDIIRILSMILVIPKLLEPKLLEKVTIAIPYFSLIGISIIVSTAQLVLLVLMTKKVNILSAPDGIFLSVFIFSIITLISYAFLGTYIALQNRAKEIANKKYRILLAISWTLTLLIWIFWISFFLQVTLFQHQILRMDIPVINIGNTSMISGVAFLVITWFLRRFKPGSAIQRKVFRTIE